MVMDLLACLIFPLFSLFFLHKVIFLLRGLLDQTIEKLQAIIGPATMRSIPVSHTAPIDQVKLPRARHESVMEVKWNVCFVCPTLKKVKRSESSGASICSTGLVWISGSCADRALVLCVGTRDTLCNAEEKESEEFADSSVLLLACFCNAWRVW